LTHKKVWKGENETNTVFHLNSTKKKKKEYNESNINNWEVYFRANGREKKKRELMVMVTGFSLPKTNIFCWQTLFLFFLNEWQTEEHNLYKRHKSTPGWILIRLNNNFEVLGIVWNKISNYTRWVISGIFYQFPCCWKEI
jgi:hypothetical protein